MKTSSCAPSPTQLTAPGPQAALDEARRRHHPFCVVCSQANHHGFQLDFVSDPAGGVQATFQGNRFLQGYPGRLHGGIIASLLDGAMTNCLFVRQCPALTAELKIRYRHPVALNGAVLVRAHLVRSLHGLHELSAQLIQDGQIKVTAHGKFMACA